MSTSTTVTCVCGYQGFIIVNALTGAQIDLQTYYATTQQRPIAPYDLKRHDPLDLSQLQMVCANPACRRVLS